MSSLILRIENFRSITRAEVELQPGLNVLIGTNGSGKTNILAALKFLRDVFRQGAGLALAKIGGPVRNYRRGTQLIRFSLTIDYGERLLARKKTKFLAHWGIVIAPSGPEGIASVERERLTITAVGTKLPVLFAEIDRRNYTRPRSTFQLADSNMVGRDLFSLLRLWPKEKKSDVFAHITTNTSETLETFKRSTDKAFAPALSTLDEVLRDAFVRLIDLNEYNILPDIARQATDQLPTAEITPNGAGVAEVIYALENKSFSRLFSRRENDLIMMTHMPVLGIDFGYFHYVTLTDTHAQRLQNRSALDGVLEKINSELALAVRPLTGVTTQVDPTNGRRFVVFHSETDNFYPEEVSDGTIKWLCILVSIFIPFSRTYVLEEPENFLHPWMQQQLIRLMREQAQHYGTTFIVTSHSATVLNASLPEEITVVKRTSGGTQASRLADMKDVCDLLETSDFGLGDLWVSGLIGAVPDEVLP